MARIKGFCCNYTLSIDVETLKQEGLVPSDLVLERLPCTGRLEVPEMLDAFTDGAEAVFVVGCEVDKCHNLSGSARASRRVAHVKKIIEELDMDPGLVEMFFAGRGESEPVIEAAKTMISRVRTDGS